MFLQGYSVNPPRSGSSSTFLSELVKCWLFYIWCSYMHWRLFNACCTYSHGLMTTPPTDTHRRLFFLGGLVQCGVINVWPVKPFETVMVIKVRIKCNWIDSTYPHTLTLTRGMGGRKCIRLLLHLVSSDGADVPSRHLPANVDSGAVHRLQLDVEGRTQTIWFTDTDSQSETWAGHQEGTLVFSKDYSRERHFAHLVIFSHLWKTSISCARLRICLNLDFNWVVEQKLQSINPSAETFNTTQQQNLVNYAVLMLLKSTLSLLSDRLTDG